MNQPNNRPGGNSPDRRGGFLLPEDIDVTAPLLPGAYLKMRRIAAGLTPADIAEQFITTPYRLEERGRAHWIELIEADAQPADVSLLVALKRLFPFDLDVVIKLERIAQGSGEAPPALCRYCGCSWEDPCDDGGRPCAWAAPHLCTACVGKDTAPALEAAA